MLEVNPQEQATLAGLRALRTGGASYRAIQKLSMAQGLVSRAGREFTLKSLYQILNKGEQIVQANGASPICQ
jgi:hypothetical protein